MWDVDAQIENDIRAAKDSHPFKKLKKGRSGDAKEQGAKGKGKGDQNGAAEELQTSKPAAVFVPKRGRNWTVSIALPGSFIAK